MKKKKLVGNNIHLEQIIFPPLPPTLKNAWPENVQERYILPQLASETQVSDPFH